MILVVKDKGSQFRRTWAALPALAILGKLNFLTFNSQTIMSLTVLTFLTGLW